MGAQPAIAADLDIENTHDALSETRSEAGDCGAEPSDEAIRLRSEQIWEREGRPEGHSEEHWARARAELAELLARTSNRDRAPHTEITEPAVIEVPASSAMEDVVVHDTPEPRDDVEQAEGADRVRIDTVEQNVIPDAPDSDLGQGQEGVRSGTHPEIRPDFTVGPGLRDRLRSLSLTKRSLGRDDIQYRFEKRANKSATLPTIISAGIELHGTLESPGDIQFAGSLEGTLGGATLFVDEDGVVRGDVIGDDVIVRGRVNGRICARKVALRAGCRVEGEILYGSLTVENGAELDGTFRRWETAQEE